MFSPRLVIKNYGLNRKRLKKSVTKKENVDNTLGNHDEKKEEKAEEKDIEKEKTSKNNKKKNKKDMAINEELISAAEEQASALSNNVKVVKKDRGLIERTESSKIILTEDNRQVLND